MHPKVARKWPRDINTEMVIEIVPVRAVNFSISAQNFDTNVFVTTATNDDNP